MKRVTGLGGVSFICTDPEDNKIELWEPIDEPLLRAAGK